MTSKYPELDAVFLNAGIQRTLSFPTLATTTLDSNATTTALETIDAEILTNYTSPLHLVVHLLPHLASLGAPGTDKPAAIVLVTSGLALVPLPRCAGYCATKAAMHSLAWTLRAQLAAPVADSDGGTTATATSHIKVIEIVPPAVQTELHSLQPDLVAAGQGSIGMPLKDFLEEAWAGLERGDDEIFIGAIRERFARVEDGKRTAFDSMVEAMRKAGMKA